MTDNSGPLARFKVIDLTRVRAGPTAVRQLADWGAQVIKVETPEHLEPGNGLGGPRLGPDFQNLHRNKRSLTLNLKEPEGRAILMKLVEDADVVVENFRPDVKRRSASTTNRCARETRASSTGPFPVSGRTDHMKRGRGSTRSRRAWAG